MPVGKPFSEVIEQELAAARCVIVLWSTESVKSQWVQNEATEGAARGILVPALIDDVRLPLEFRRLHTANLAGGTGELEDLLSSVAALVTAPGASVNIPPAPVIDPPAWMGFRSIAVAAIVLLSIVISIAIWSKRDRAAADRATSHTVRTATATTTTIAPTTNTTTETPLEVDRKQSAALIVGVSRFSQDETVAEVPYAVDDAVDLAFVLVLDERVRLIAPERVVLAISGVPRKPESQQSLNILKAAGVQVRSAGQADILDALDKQARAAGRNGALFITFATHGMSIDDRQYLLTATSVLRHPETAVPESRIRDVASSSNAEQSLILIDACHVRSNGDGRSVAALVRAIPEVKDRLAFSPRRSVNIPMMTFGAMKALLFGTTTTPSRPKSEAKPQVVLSAAAEGQYAYDDDVRRNGVFTAAVIDGLRCGAETDERGLVTIYTLAKYVEQRILTWIHKNRNKNVTRATQLTWYGEVKPMALAGCRQR